MEINSLIKKTEDLIEYIKSVNPDITHLETHHAPLIAQIVCNYNLTPAPFGTIPEAQMIFLGAPTGAGKDTLNRKIELENKDTNFVTLNMDMFRHYHNEIIGSDAFISDEEYAKVTNQTSYELYYIIQELILREFPGTNIIITGTMRDLDWIQEISDRYRYDKRTKYKLSLATLAVPTKESALSIFERYLRMVDTRDLSSNAPLRYTDLKYHGDSIKRFTDNVMFMENDLHQNPGNSYFSSIKVYRRSKDITDFSEDTLVYDSSNPDPNMCAHSHILNIMNTEPEFDPDRVYELLEIIKRNGDYLKKQGLYESIITNIKNIVTKSKEVSKLPDDDNEEK